MRRVRCIGGAIEYQLVLPAYLIDEQVRQASIRPLIESAGPLSLYAPSPRRRVWRDQHICARRLDCAGHVLEPKVFTNRQADIDRAIGVSHMRAFARIKQPLLIEHAIVRQVPLVVSPQHFAIG